MSHLTRKPVQGQKVKRSRGQNRCPSVCRWSLSLRL